MTITQKQKSKLEGKIWERWYLPEELFGDVGADIYDFEAHNYNFFIDNVESINQLLEGLQHLSPLADDALNVAEKMKEREFIEFKKALQYERKMEDSRLSNNYLSLVIPQRFISATLLADKYGAPLGTALIQIMKEEIKSGEKSK